MSKAEINFGESGGISAPLKFHVYAGAAGSTAYVYFLKETIDAYGFQTIKCTSKNSNVSYVKMFKDGQSSIDMTLNTEYDISDVNVQIEVVVYAASGKGMCYFEMS